MKYQPPYGVTDPDAPYINGNPAAGIEGSIPPAAAFEYPMREIVHLIQANDYVPSDSDLNQLLMSVRRQFVNYAVDTGGVNSMVVTLTPALVTYHAGLPLRVLVANTNTGPAVINVNGLGTRAIKRGDGTDLQASDVTAGMIANLVDTGTVFQLQNPLRGTPATQNNLFIKIPYTVDTGAVNALVAPFTPPITAVTEGDFISVRVKNTNTGPTTIAVNALAALPIKRDDGLDLQAGDLLALEQILLENHSAYWQVLGLVRSQVLLPPAPKLRGLIADGTGYGSQGFASSTPGGQAIAYYGVRKNNAQTSTFDGLTLTCGAGEDGVWAVYGALHTAQIGVAVNFASIALFVNGAEAATESMGNMSANTGNGLSVTAHVQLAVGDQLQVRFYHQAGTNMFSSPDNRTRMSAFLISK